MKKNKNAHLYIIYSVNLKNINKDIFFTKKFLFFFLSSNSIKFISSCHSSKFDRENVNGLEISYVGTKKLDNSWIGTHRVQGEYGPTTSRAECHGRGRE